LVFEVTSATQNTARDQLEIAGLDFRFPDSIQQKVGPIRQIPLFSFFVDAWLEQLLL
jgi:hypothetical protein